MSTTTSHTSQTEILARCLDLSSDRLTGETAQFLVGLELDEHDRERLDALAEKSRLGILGEAECCELEEYRRAGRMMEMIKIKARQALDNGKQSSAQHG